jgi:putative Mg2+ transporter-C (MgtC) family protein
VIVRRCRTRAPECEARQESLPSTLQSIGALNNLGNAKEKEQLMLEWHDIILRFGAATLTGAVMGVYLELRGKPTGVRMLGLVALASAVAVAVAEHSEADTSRVIQGVITGVGFLGAGVILHIGRDPGAVHGLSTAATIWLTASLGVLCGLAAWRLLAVAVVFTVILLIAGRVAERWAGLPDR